MSAGSRSTLRPVPQSSVHTSMDSTARFRADSQPANSSALLRSRTEQSSTQVPSFGSQRPSSSSQTAAPRSHTVWPGRDLHPSGPPSPSAPRALPPPIQRLPVAFLTAHTGGAFAASTHGADAETDVLSSIGAGSLGQMPHPEPSQKLRFPERIPAHMGGRRGMDAYLGRAELFETWWEPAGRAVTPSLDELRAQDRAQVRDVSQNVLEEPGKEEPMLDDFHSQT